MQHRTILFKIFLIGVGLLASTANVYATQVTYAQVLSDVCTALNVNLSGPNQSPQFDIENAKSKATLTYLTGLMDSGRWEAEQIASSGASGNTAGVGGIFGSNGVLVNLIANVKTINDQISSMVSSINNLVSSNNDISDRLSNKFTMSPTIDSGITPSITGKYGFGSSSVSGVSYSSPTDVVLYNSNSLTLMSNDGDAYVSGIPGAGYANIVYEGVDGVFFDPIWTWTMAAAALQFHGIGAPAHYATTDAVTDNAVNINFFDYKATASIDAVTAYNAILASQTFPGIKPRNVMGLGDSIIIDSGARMPSNVYRVQQVLNKLARNRAVELGLEAAQDETLAELTTHVTPASPALDVHNKVSSPDTERPVRTLTE